MVVGYSGRVILPECLFVSDLPMLFVCVYVCLSKCNIFHIILSIRLDLKVNFFHEVKRVNMN